MWMLSSTYDNVEIEKTSFFNKLLTLGLSVIAKM